MRTRALHHQAVEDLLLAVLRDAQGFPLSTRQIAEQAGPAAQPSDLVCGKRLRALLARGEVERLTVEGNRQAYWRAR